MSDMKPKNNMDEAANHGTLTGDYSKLFEAVDRYQREPWQLYKEPFQITDHIYYVGNTFVGCYLIDTGAGLVLIDTAFQATVAQVVHNIHKIGYDPKDIHHIFISHAHLDHCGGARYMQSFAAEDVKTYLGQEDMFFLTERRDLLFASDPDQVPEFEAIPYDYDAPMVIGDVTFTFRHTPGHTPGCTTFLIETSIGGEKLTAAMHGGLGLIGLSFPELEERRLPKELHYAFHDQLEACKSMEVDVVIPSHNKDHDIFVKAAQDDGSHKVFIDRTAWAKVMDSKLQAYQRIY